MQFELSGQTIKTTRKTHDIIEMIAVTGGLAYFLISLIGMVLAPWARYQYLLEMLKKLYWVKTKHNVIFRGSRKPENVTRLAQIKDAVQKHGRLDQPVEADKLRFGKINMLQNLYLFFKEYVFLWCCCLCYSRNPHNLDDVLMRWFRLGVENFEKETDIVRIVRKLRELKLLTRDSRYRNGLKYRL